MRRRKANIFTKLVVLALVIYASVSLIGLHGQIEAARESRLALERVVAEQALENAVYEYELDNRYDPEMIERIARNRLGLVRPGERVFYGTTN
ncbi:MAG: septum formation initiator family protein [Oscillospiraceae bacterium]|nr:septum formation initiator family protein [Oscillospiraceae bacterium]